MYVRKTPYLVLVFQTSEISFLFGDSCTIIETIVYRIVENYCYVNFTVYQLSMVVLNDGWNNSYIEYIISETELDKSIISVQQNYTFLEKFKLETNCLCFLFFYVLGFSICSLHEGTQWDQSCPFNRMHFLSNVWRDLDYNIEGGIVFTVLGQILIVQIGPP
jgi:hypothetical protein